MLFLLGSAMAGALVGVTWVPPGIGSFSWSDAEGFSGTLVGEYDGWLRPPLSFQGGWVQGKNALMGSLSLAFVQESQFASTSSSHNVGGLRPGLDYRRYLRAREPGQVNGWLDGGIYGVIPFAEDVSDAYTPEEQADADEGAKSARERVGLYGGQAGLGAEYLLGDKAGKPAVALGMRYFLKVGATQATQEEDGFSVSTLWLTEAGLYLEFQL